MSTVNLPNHPDSWPEFDKWFNDSFIKRNGGYKPTNVRNWWRRVESCHDGVRKLLGGVRFERIYKLKSQQHPVDMKDAGPIIDKILQIVPDYLGYYGYTKEAFLMPFIENGTHNAVKVGKHVRTHAENRRASSWEAVPGDNLRVLDKLLSDLGTLWAKNRTSDTELQVTITTSPRSFLLLGHYGPDADSCFRQGSERTDNKWMVGQSKNTFVISISRFNPKKGKFQNVARCFGFTNESQTVFNLCNYYFVPGFMEGDALEAVRMALEDLWQDKSSFFENRIAAFRSVYLNPYGKWSFAKGDSKELITQSLVINTNNIQTFVCPACGVADNRDTNWKEVDDDFVCNSCASKANKCDKTDRLTLKYLVPLINEIGIKIYVHPDVVKEMKKCGECNIHAESTCSVNDVDLCLDCIETKYNFCHCCEKYVTEEEMFEPSQTDICIQCVDNGNGFPFDHDSVEFILSRMVDITADVE